MADYEEEDYDENSSVEDDEEELFDEEIFENEGTDVLEPENGENEENENEVDVFWEDGVVEDEDTSVNESSASLHVQKQKQQYKTRAYMTKYEFAKVIGVRSEQILYGSQVLVDTSNTDPIKIALDELRERKLPFLVRRKIHEKNKYVYEDWKVESFKNIDWLLEYYDY